MMENDSEIEYWRSRVADLGIKVDRRWSLETLIEKAHGASDEDVAEMEPEPEPEPAPEPTPVADERPEPPSSLEGLRRVAPRVYVDRRGRRIVR